MRSRRARMSARRRLDRPARQTGITRFELLNSIFIICVLAVVLLHQLLRYQDLAKTAVMEMTVTNMRSGLRLRVAELMMANRSDEISKLVGQNPVQWLQAPPSNYRGIAAIADRRTLQRESWYFDPERHELFHLLPSSNNLLETNVASKTLIVKVTAVNQAMQSVSGTVAQGVALTSLYTND